MKQPLEKIKKLEPILLKIAEIGGISYLVGGAVRDFVLNIDSNDIDIEVHNLSLLDLEKILKEFGNVRVVGKKFGVLRIDRVSVDWSLPRKDSSGRWPEVDIDQNMHIEDALRRRDITMNAMAINLKKLLAKKKFSLSLIIDPFNGLKDIQKKQLRVVDEKLFLEDPLRFFRVVQFIARFEMMPDKQLERVCKRIDLHDITTDRIISKERIFAEIKKLLLKSNKPSLGFRWLKRIGRLQEIFPEIYNLINIYQQNNDNCDVDLFEHTMQGLDTVASFKHYKYNKNRLLILFSILCHDFGKVKIMDLTLSKNINKPLDLFITKKFMKRLTDNKILIAAVSKLVFYHIKPFIFLEENANSSNYKKLALKLFPETDLHNLAIVAFADKQGWNKKEHGPLFKFYIDKYKRFLMNAKNAHVEYQPEKPVLLGRDILKMVKPGPIMGKILKYAYKIQIEEGLKNKDELIKRVLS